jgi:hypothetical protein
MYLLGPLSCAQRTPADATEEEKHILYHVDHTELAAQLRQFATEMRWGRNEKKGEPNILWANDSRIPPGLEGLSPTSIAVFDDRIILECGGGLFHFGVVAFRQGIEGSGTKKLGVGLWFFAEDGRVPSR